MACDLHKDPNNIWNYKGVPSHNFEKELSAAPRFNLMTYKTEAGYTVIIGARILTTGW